MNRVNKPNFNKHKFNKPTQLIMETKLSRPNSNQLRISKLTSSKLVTLKSKLIKNKQLQANKQNKIHKIYLLKLIKENYQTMASKLKT